MTWLKRLFGPKPPPIAEAQGGDTYAFLGTFTSELEATDHSLQDLPRALGLQIGPNDFEVFHGDRLPYVLPMLTPRPDPGQATTLILLTLPDGGALRDTQTLRFAGKVEIA